LEDIDENALRAFRMDALQKKFENPEMSSLLRATGTSKLYKHVSRSQPKLDSDLMAVRSKL